MKRADAFTCQHKEITSTELMEEAGIKLYHCLLEERKPKLNEDSIVILSGMGNNGGDGLVVARYLIEDGFDVHVILIGNISAITVETRENLDKLITLHAKISYYEEESYCECETMICKASLIVDGIFGIGLNKEVSGIYQRAIEKVNQSAAYVASIDIPSGLRGDNGRIAGTCIKADLTMIVNNYKIGNLLNDAKDVQGKKVLLDIGIFEDENKSNKYYLKPSSLLPMPKRKNNSHKYDYGSVLVLGGSESMTGAVLMSGYSALRTGSGLCTIGILYKYFDKINNIYPEIMIRSYKDQEELLELLTKKSAIALGPGLGRKDSYGKWLELLLEQKIPMVVDADGLYYLQPLLQEGKDYTHIVITPHVGECSGLLGVNCNAIMSDPVHYVKSLADRFGMTVILKGPCSIIANRERMYFCDQGNPGMATAGMGDVLTGMITSLIGQGFETFEASKIGVYLHSLCGDLCAKDLGEYSMMATDLLKYLPLAIGTLLPKNKLKTND